jgi:hypothetical protein
MLASMYQRWKMLPIHTRARTHTVRQREGVRDMAAGKQRWEQPINSATDGGDVMRLTDAETLSKHRAHGTAFESCWYCNNNNNSSSGGGGGSSVQYLFLLFLDLLVVRADVSRNFVLARLVALVALQILPVYQPHAVGTAGAATRGGWFGWLIGKLLGRRRHDIGLSCSDIRATLVVLLLHTRISCHGACGWRWKNDRCCCNSIDR